MEFFKKISDEVWIGIIFILVAIWMLIMNISYVFIAVTLAAIGAFFVIIDLAKKFEKKTKEEKSNKKEIKKVEKK